MNTSRMTNILGIEALPTFKNADVERLVWQQMRPSGGGGIYEYQAFLQAFYKQIPQMNEHTSVRYVDRYTRDVVVAEWPTNQTFPHVIAWVNKSGAKAWLTRLRVRVHKWFVDHRYHPADKPVFWQPWTSDAGLTPIYPDMPPTWNVHQRTIELKWFGMSFGYDTVFSGNERYRARQFAICCAYDGATDTLYVRE